VVRLVVWRDIDSGALQVIVDDHTQYRSRVRHGHECLAHQIPRTDGLERSETVVTRQDHHQRLLDERTERQLRHALFTSKKSCIPCPFRDFQKSLFAPPMDESIPSRGAFESILNAARSSAARSTKRPAWLPIARSGCLQSCWSRNRNCLLY